MIRIVRPGAAALAGLVVMVTMGGLVGCSQNQGSDSETIDRRRDAIQRGIGGRTQPSDSGLFGPGGLFGSRDDKRKGLDEPGIAVNAYLWRASLDTVSFMPLASADPFGGTIITDWYTPPENPNERMKVQVTILDRDLRADGVRASVFRQTMAGNRGWVDANVDPRTSLELENQILTRARQLRIAQTGQ
ncbi:DUF3576 domain-containing protein [Reyranella sp. CPCC 100927]|uniref:DUF3576 domain-containing protein n=1 Tax=Reyranella sp. CPCC 100927 TaxID=2599616 RepID=UPI001C49A471|nr:DUF3576 domain-containing protein [Reyranella sp. CPCC 100927]